MIFFCKKSFLILFWGGVGGQGGRLKMHSKEHIHYGRIIAQAKHSLYNDPNAVIGHYISDFSRPFTGGNMKGRSINPLVYIAHPSAIR